MEKFVMLLVRALTSVPETLGILRRAILEDILNNVVAITSALGRRFEVQIVIVIVRRARTIVVL
jgi:hypothetical protein